MKEAKTIPTGADVDAFIASVADEKKRQDSYKMIDIMSEITGEKPRMWGPGIIGFGQYHYKYDSGHEGDAALVGFSPRKQSFSIYLMAGFIATEYEGYDDLLARLGKYKTGKGCLYVNKLDDVNLDVLKQLIRISYDFLKKKYSN